MSKAGGNVNDNVNVNVNDNVNDNAHTRGANSDTIAIWLLRRTTHMAKDLAKM